jgi:two-component system LytT family response regulator
MRVLIVDDEPLARRGLRHELDQLSGVTCVGECAGPDEAVQAIRDQRPDLVLLDVQLGRATGFEVVERIGADAMPLVVFVTAYDRHALRAFEVHAVDYVLKPVDPIRLREALDHAARQHALEQGPSLAQRLEHLLVSRAAAPGSEPPPHAAPLARIPVRDGDRTTFVDVDAIDWIEARGNVALLHVGARHHALRGPITRLEALLAGTFIRIRRSMLVNARAIVAVELYGKGMYTVTLRSGVKLVSSRYHQGQLHALLHTPSAVVPPDSRRRTGGRAPP